MPSFEELRFPSADASLQLYARDYPGDGPAIVMMHGLTRNSSDFEGLAAHLVGRHRLIVPDQRGRGRSDRDPQPANYVPATYSADMLGMIARLGLDRPILIGTSMGGLMAMIMAALHPGGFRGLVLNDVGPEVEPAGLSRIASYVGARTPITDWADAAEYCRRTNGYAFPGRDDAFWQAFARRLFQENAAGVPELAYDPAIASGLASASPSAVPPDLWPMWQSLANVPILAVRGAISDILSEDTLHKMARLHPVMRSAMIAGVGHAPLLDEPEALAAIDSFLAEVS